MFQFFKKTRRSSEESAEGYLLFQDGSKWGPFTREELAEMLSSGELKEESMIKDNEVWHPVTEIPWLASAFGTQQEFQEEISEDPTPEAFPDGGEETASGKQVICPHCWYQFDLSQINFISRHIDLIGDPILGPEAQQRFLPTHFNEQGYAIDAKGVVCQDMACPHCHLKLPEAVIDLPSSLFSIVGAPASGKSYYLTAMIWQLRNILAKKFDYTLSDTDESFNSVLNHYESILFLNRRGDTYVALPKTELQGNDFSNQILLNGMSVDLPLPFIFTLTPMRSNSNFDDPSSGMRNIILYDNAGEHFEPGRDHITNLATQHLVYSDSIAFLYDPIKDTRMVTQCSEMDPQVQQVGRGANQLVLLNEMIARIRKYAGLRSREKYDRPLIVIIPKYDAWKHSFPIDLEQTEFTYYNSDEMKYYLNMSVITNASFVMREILLRLSPEVVATCESFFSTVFFLPVSALGRMPEYDPEKDMIAIKPTSLKPTWAEVPMLLQFWYAGVISAVVSCKKSYIPVEQYKFVEDALIYMLPGGNERETVPGNYWGQIVYSSKLDRYIKFPNAPEKDSPAQAAEDDFWKE